MHGQCVPGDGAGLRQRRDVNGHETCRKSREWKGHAHRSCGVLLDEPAGGRDDEETAMTSSAGGEEGEGVVDVWLLCANRGDEEVEGAEGITAVHSSELGSPHVVVATGSLHFGPSPKHHQRGREEEVEGKRDPDLGGG